MSPTPRPSRAAARTAAAATVLLALAGTGLAAAAGSPARSALDPARAARPVAAAPTATAGARPAAVVAGAAQTTARPSTQYCTMTRRPDYVEGQVVQSTTFEDGTSVWPWKTDRAVVDPPVVSSAAAHQGSAGMRVAGLNSAVLEYPVTGTMTEGLYTISFWVRESPELTHASGASLYAFVYDEASQTTLASVTPRISGDWTQVQMTVRPTMTHGICNQWVASPLTVHVWPVAAPCSDVAQLPLDIDDVSVTFAGRDNTPTSTTPMSTVTMTTKAASADTRVEPACTRPPTTTTKPAAAVCKVKVSRSLTWSTGTQLQVSVTSRTRLSGWTLTATLASGQTVGYAWPGSVGQNGTQLTLRPLSGYADPLEASTPAKFGLVLSGYAAPTGWAIDGQTCKVG